MTANRLKHIQSRIAPTVNARVVALDIVRIPDEPKSSIAALPSRAN